MHYEFLKAGRRNTLLLISVVALVISLASLAYTLTLVWSLSNTLRGLLETLEELEAKRRELEELKNALENSSTILDNPWYPAVSLEVRGVSYILPSGACTPFWREAYGDRIMFYAKANLTEYADLIRGDFRVISKVFNLVVVMIPGDDTPLFRENLKVVDRIAGEEGLKVMWVILPKWKYGDERDYLTPGTPVNRLVVELMKYLSTMGSTWRIGVWYGWQDRASPSDVAAFYASLPEDVKGLYSVWIDQPFIERMTGLRGQLPDDVLVATELYSEQYIEAYSGLFKTQMIVTGYSGAEGPADWLEAAARRLALVRGVNRIVTIWTFYDIGDGHGERYAWYFPNQPLADPYHLRLVPSTGHG